MSIYIHFSFLINFFRDALFFGWNFYEYFLSHFINSCQHFNYTIIIIFLKNIFSGIFIKRFFLTDIVNIFQFNITSCIWNEFSSNIIRICLKILDPSILKCFFIFTFIIFRLLESNIKLTFSDMFFSPDNMFLCVIKTL